jgi:hypothetical protein
METIGVKWQNRWKDSRFALRHMRNFSPYHPKLEWIGGKPSHANFYIAKLIKYGIC